MTTDIDVTDGGSVNIVTPLTDTATDWINENVSDEGYHPYWPSLVVESRYLGDLLFGMQSDGLTLTYDGEPMTLEVAQ